MLTDEEALEWADAAFIGTLAEIITPGGTSDSSADPERFVFDVEAVFTGDVFARQSVVTARDGASCGLEISGPGPRPSTPPRSTTATTRGFSVAIATHAVTLPTENDSLARCSLPSPPQPPA